MQLLDLPLILVQDIIQTLVLNPSQGSSTESSTLELRLVNSVFEREITKYWGRHQLCATLPLDQICRSPPHDFIVRLLREHIGLGDRNECKFASKAHAAVDMLTEQFLNLTGEQKQRDDMLDDACDVMMLSDFYGRAFFEWGPCEKPPTGQRFEFDQCDVLEMAICIATMKPYRSIFRGLLSALADELKEKCSHALKRRWGWIDQTKHSRWPIAGPLKHSRWPMYYAIRFRHIDFLRSWLKGGVELRNVPSLGRALTEAASAGHEGMIDFVASHMEHNMKSAEILVKVPARNQRWDLARKLLGWHGTSMHMPPYRTVLCWASRHGKDDMILEIMEHGIGPRPRYAPPPEWKMWAIREAVRGGHHSTVRLLLENGAIGDVRNSHVDLLARYVAISDNYQIFRILEEYHFWKPNCEHHFLPLAAEYGHGYSTLYAIEKLGNRKIKVVPALKHLSPTEQLQYFSLFRAVIRGRLSTVQLLVPEVGLSLSEKVCWPKGRYDEVCDGPLMLSEGVPCLTALVLAVDAGNVSMVRLLVDRLGAEPLSEEEWTLLGYPSEGYWRKTRFHEREARKERLEEWRTILKLGNDYSTSYTDAPWSAVSEAYLAARESAA